MGGFNPINLIFNTPALTAANRAQGENPGQQAAQNSSGAQNTAVNEASGNTVQNAGNSSFSPINYSNAAQNSSLIRQSTLSTASKALISTVEIEQQANYIKDLLNLPRDFETFINQIQSENNPNTPVLQQLSKLLVNGKINLNALSALLTGNSKDAVQKLMATIAAVSRMGADNIEQLKQLVNLFRGTDGGTEAQQVVKNLLMLYLPYLPLSVRNDMNLDFNIDIFDKITGPDPDKEDNIETIKIMIQTANYGNILARLEMAPNNEVDIFLDTSGNFPEKEVLEMLKSENKKSNIRTNLAIEKKERAAEMSEMQNVQVVSSNYVSPKLLLCAHALIKIIIEVDAREFIINKESES